MRSGVRGDDSRLGFLVGLALSKPALPAWLPALVVEGFATVERIPVADGL